MPKRAQVAPIILIVVAILVFAYASTIIIGELGFQRIRMANVADGALISATSRLCQAFNQIRPLHNQMFLASLRTQASIGVRIYPHIAIGYSATYAMSLPTIIQNRSLFNQANKIAKEASDSLRMSVYEAVFGGALVDEPKPFEPNEVVEKNGQIVEFKYDLYNKRDSDFMKLWKRFKKGEGEFSSKKRAGPKDWFKNHEITYYYNKSKNKVLSQPGVLVLEEDPKPTYNYEAYVQLRLEDFPRRISVSSFKIAYIFLSCLPCCPPEVPCCFIPGFVYNHWAWIKGLKIDKKAFKIIVSKGISGEKLPLLKREGQVVLRHITKVRLKGSLWSGFDFKLDRSD